MSVARDVPAAHLRKPIVAPSVLHCVIMLDGKMLVVGPSTANFPVHSSLLGFDPTLLFVQSSVLTRVSSRRSSMSVARDVPAAHLRNQSWRLSYGIVLSCWMEKCWLLDLPQPIFRFTARCSVLTQRLVCAELRFDPSFPPSKLHVCSKGRARCASTKTNRGAFRIALCYHVGWKNAGCRTFHSQFSGSQLAARF